ncbi:hypothetical protein D8780_15395 [Notoacmeibacter ruber]|uniref:Uncharacterized protein n=1 Tax=Notoacmeibacter ruber TaxID=2670375 RepID=A0A3L7J3C2_9HYPH|nr:hypothetical protein D8780_15395 [Notoacmeibacter ruber]
MSPQALADRFGVSVRTIHYTVRSEKERRRDNASRTRQVNVTLTEDELAAFDAALSRQKVSSRSEGLRRLIHAANGMFVSDPALSDDLNSYRVALNRVGNNVSQIAKRMNAAKLRGERLPFNDDDLLQIRSLALMVMTFGDQLQGLIQRQREGLSIETTKALKEFADDAEPQNSDV